MIAKLISGLFFFFFLNKSLKENRKLVFFSLICERKNSGTENLFTWVNRF